MVSATGLIATAEVAMQAPAKADTPIWNQTVIGSQIGVPNSIAVGPSGQIFETQGNLVIKMDADGANQTVIGSGFDQPYGVAVDTSDHVFVVDSQHNQLVRMNSDGTNQTTIGSGFDQPFGVAVDTSGHVYVTDRFRVIKINSDGTNQTTIGIRFSSPWGVAIDADGHVFVADPGAQRIVRMDSDGTNQISIVLKDVRARGLALDATGHLCVIDGLHNRLIKMNTDGTNQTTISSNFSNSWNVAIDATGHFLVTDYGRRSIVKMDADGTNQTTTGPGFAGPMGVAVDNTGHVFLADAGNNQVMIMNADGSNPTSIGSGFSLPHGVAVDNTGNVYVADPNNKRIVSMNADGSNQKTIGSGFSNPSGVAVDTSGHIYVADFYSWGARRIVKMDADGTNQTTIGPAFSMPIAVAVDNSGHVYVASWESTSVTRMNADGSNPTAIGSGLSYPSGVAVDTFGHVFVADYSNNRVVEMDIDGSNQTPIGSGFSYPAGVAVDALGRIFVGDSGNNRIIRLVQASIPGAPTITSVTRGNGQATISWTDGSSNGSVIQSYSIYAYSGASLVATKTNCSGSPCAITGLTNGTSYTFKVSDTNGVGEGALSSASSAVTPAAVPSAPTNTSATRGNTQATIAWTDGSSNGSSITGRIIYVFSGASLVSTETDCLGSPCVVTGLTNGTSYTFKVSDTNEVGEGALSSASSAVTPAKVPGAPQNVTVVAAGGQATVSWTPPASNGGSPIFSYSVASGARTCSYTVSSPETDTCTITGLTNGSSYTFSVTATNGVGTGSASTGVSGTVLFPAPVLTSAVAAKNQITLTWTAPTVTDGKIVSFTGSASDGNGHSFYCSGAKTATKCTITGLTDLTTYTTSVKATENKGGTISALSNTISATPAEPLTLPYLHPVTLTSNPHTVTIIWGAASGGDGQTPHYAVKVFNPNGSTFSSTQTTGNTATASGLTKGTKYTYTITTSTEASVAGWIPAVTTKVVKFTAK